MFNRREIKEKGKIAFKMNYWKCVLVSLILTAITASGGSAGRNSSSQSSQESADSISSAISSVPAGIWGIVAGVAFVAVIVAIALAIFVFNPLELGCLNFFKRNNEEENTELGALGYGFSVNYLRNVSTLFFRGLFTALWTLLFIIPGIIKAYEYAMIPYILADNPEISRKEAFALSKQMMNGNKWNTFVFDLSFILWFILSAITLGIVGVFYVNPYYNSSRANLYITLRDAGKRAVEAPIEDAFVEEL